MTRRRWYFLLAVVFALHNTEEWIAAPRLVELMRTRAPLLLADLYSGVDVAGLRPGLAALIVAGFTLAAVASFSPDTPGAAGAMLVFAAVMAINALAHVVLSMRFGEVMPGVVTAVLLTGPVSAAALVRGRREAWVPPPAYWWVLPAALLVHGPLLAAFIRGPVRWLSPR